MPNAYISGTGFYVPPRVVTNDDLVNKFAIDTSDQWIRRRTGIKERRFTDAGVSTSDLAVPAAEMALAAADLDKTEIDMIVFATLTPDWAYPGCGVLLQEKLGLCEAGRFVPALDIRNQCSGFLYGLATAACMVQSGSYRNVLLVGAEVQSHAMDLAAGNPELVSMFGDGAGAVVVSATAEDRGVRDWWLGADGRFAEALCQKVWDISRWPYIPTNGDGIGQVQPEALWARMEGQPLLWNSVSRMIESVTRVCDRQNLSLNDIDLFFFHQANLKINQYVQQQLRLPDEKLVHNIDKYGNTTAASIPLLLAETEREGRLRPGMKVAMVAFGSGFTWGAAIVDW